MTEDRGQIDSRIPWVTFCMTTYKRPEFLKKQIQSILKQTFSNFSVIISDNDSYGSAKQVVEAFGDSRLFYYLNETNLGMVKSFNRSLARAVSEYVVMITDDDPVYPEMLETLHDLSIKYPEYGMFMGGCDIMCLNPTVADSSRLKVGTNSCLADLPLGTVRKYTGEEFPFSYFKNEIGGHLLWSTGIVKREIAMAMNGMPDFGAPYNTDFGFIVLCGSYSGAVLVNTALGCQVVHGENYGFTESDFDNLYLTPDAFYRWVTDRLPTWHNFEGLGNHIRTFLARWVVEYAVSINKFLKRNKKDKRNFNNYIHKIFKISYLRKWKWKYYIAVSFPNTFELLVYFKGRIMK